MFLFDWFGMRSQNLWIGRTRCQIEVLSDNIVHLILRLILVQNDETAGLGRT